MKTVRSAIKPLIMFIQTFLIAFKYNSSDFANIYVKMICFLFTLLWILLIFFKTVINIDFVFRFENKYLLNLLSFKKLLICHVNYEEN